MCTCANVCIYIPTYKLYKILYKCSSEARERERESFGVHGVFIITVVIVGYRTHHARKSYCQ